MKVIRERFPQNHLFPVPYVDKFVIKGHGFEFDIKPERAQSLPTHVQHTHCRRIPGGISSTRTVRTIKILSGAAAVRVLGECRIRTRDPWLFTFVDKFVVSRVGKPAVEAIH